MSLRTTDGGSSSHDSSESQPFKVKDSRKMPKTMLRHLDNVTLRQRLQPSKNGDAVIVMKFNSDGNLLATAGKDSFVYVWVLNKHKHQFNSNRKSIEVTPEFLAAEEEEEGPEIQINILQQYTDIANFEQYIDLYLRSFFLFFSC